MAQVIAARQNVTDDNGLDDHEPPFGSLLIAWCSCLNPCRMLVMRFETAALLAELDSLAFPGRMRLLAARARELAGSRELGGYHGKWGSPFPRTELEALRSAWREHREPQSPNPLPR
jgi:hypothetical protein